MSWQDLEPSAESARRLEELAIDEGAPDGPRASRHVSCQPAMEFRGRVGDWVADVRQARERGDTVLFVAESAGRAERTAEILRDYEIVALPIDDADASPSAAVLIAVGILMVYARRFMSRFQGEGAVLTRWLPLTSAAVITAFGVAIVVQAFVAAGILQIQI